MLTIYTDEHYQHQPSGEIYGGKLVPPFECAQRVEYVLERIQQVNLGKVREPEEFSEDAILRVHDQAFVEFLKTCWQQWIQAGFDTQILPTVWPARGMQQREPEDIDGKIGYFALAAETAMVEGTWTAAWASAMTALTGAKAIQGGSSSAFALCRPPGHHAARDLFGGYCFLNNAAIAAQYLLDQGSKRIAIVDPDFHHGNGTQDIFYHRSDVLFCSLHGHPSLAFPNFLGYQEETGSGAGEGYNHNYPMMRGTEFTVWRKALEDALNKVKSFSPDALIISLGVDTFENDPISFFKLKSDDFKTYGHMIGQLNIPTLFVMEGGYAVEEVGINAVNVLMGFEDQT